MSLAASLIPRALRPIYEKVMQDQRLTAEDGITLLESPDLFALGAIADEARRRRVGDYVYFNNNAHINYSNICALWNVCTFCAFGKQNKVDTEGYTYSIEQMVEKAKAYARLGVTEFHMVGGLHPDMPFSYYTDFLSAIKAAVPQAHLKCFTAVEIDFFCRKFRMSTEEVLLRLREAGHGSMTGGGAEMFHPEVHNVLCKGKMSGDRYLEIHRIAHGLGIRTTCTMLYGHIEKPYHVVDHMLRLRELQDETGGETAFIPLAFHPTNTELAHLPGPTGYYDLKIIAVARLLLDNIKAIKSYWVMISPRIAQVSLNFGANDIDGTVREEKIYHFAGATTPMAQQQEDLLRLIRQAGRIPAERDTVYNVLRVYDSVTAQG
ncbi:MAG TPA: aminofutalosine synthase MqnE [Symbiobacteriaceae bacterium]|nr:aminofutalosine synthase MqnE [Symbiobacteriaceae bacterium]